jgi:hypothetical protein
MINISSNTNITCLYSSKHLQYILKKKIWKNDFQDILYVECDKFINNTLYIIFPTELWITSYKETSTQIKVPIVPVDKLRFVKFLYIQGISKHF